jgi:hypothetical protein
MVKKTLLVRCRRAGCWKFADLVFVVAAMLWLSSAAPGQTGSFSFHRKPTGAAPTPAKPVFTSSQPPAFEIPVEPLGFFAPGAIYQGQRESLVSLDFLDENKLLFTFHAPGLIHREGDRTATADERQIRAVVLSLPQGTVTAEALWTLHDRARYLWMLNDGHFLLRNQSTLQMGDASLELKPLFHFQGPLLWLELDPTQQLMVTNSAEPAGSKSQPGDVPSPWTASADVVPDALKPDIVLRILRRISGQVMLVSRVRTTVHLPINAEGYLETLRGKGHEWVLDLNYFTGGNRLIGKLDSTCAPSLEFLTQTKVLVTTCNPDGGRWMVAMSTDGKHLWNASSPPTQIWPRLVRSPDGTRVARETLKASHPVATMAPLSFDDIKGQLVEVYDAENGKRELMAPASPILDGGGNVAISPSGRRVAILNAGAIQVYELPAPGQMLDGNPGNL